MNEEDITKEEATADKQQTIRQKRIAQLAPFQYKKGQSGNLLGRYNGGKSGKERVKAKIAGMSHEEFEEFLEGMSKIDIFKMAEGNPDSKTEETGSLKVLLIDKELANIYGIRTTPETNGSSQELNKIQGS